MTDLLTLPEVARRLRISRSFAYQLAQENTIPTIRIGDRAIRVPADQLDEWISHRTSERPPPGAA